MLNWMQKNKWNFLLWSFFTAQAIRYEYERRGSFEIGSEYLIVFMPVFIHVAKMMWNDSKELCSEELTEGWIDR